VFPRDNENYIGQFTFNSSYFFQSVWGLSDLTVLAAESSFEIDFEQIVDVFTNNRKNSRIMLR